ncbi:MAG: isopentenyl phosphate kinase family protein [Thermoprotei archaeon]|nr:isopentenyl phosphate kinase family protein [Thermoprotei archaeon]
MPKTVIIKLGGSAITVKDRPLTPRVKVIDNIAIELMEFKDEWRIILIHGAGSFGHPQAKKYGLNKGYRGAWQLRGVTETKTAVERLNLIVLERFLEKGIYAFPIHPSSIAMNAAGKLIYINEEMIKRVMNLGLVPLLHGDIVMDRKYGFSILSGDTIARYLAIQLRADLLIFGMDVDGVYDRDPKLFPNARLIKELHTRDLTKLKLSRNVRADVTGGIKRKLNEAIQAARSGIKVVLINITVPGNLSTVLKGKLPERCTLLL